MTILLRAVMFLLIIGLTSCYELQSDEELREDIIGTWESEYCKYPHSNNPIDATSESPLRTIMTFSSDGMIVEGGDYAFCVETGCDTNGVTSYCTCAWFIEDGHLTIVSDYPTAPYGWLGIAIPIECLKDDRLVFGNFRQFNNSSVKKSCYSRK